MDLESRIINQIDTAVDNNTLLFFKSGVGQHFKDINGFYAVLLSKISQHQNTITKMLFETKSLNQPITKDHKIVKVMKDVEIKLDEIEIHLKEALVHAKLLNNARQ